MSGVWPVNQDIFTDDEYLSSNITDRLDPVLNCPNNYISDKKKELIKDSSINSQSSFIPVQENDSSTMEIDFSLSKSTSCIMPEQVYPFPKANPCSSKKGGRKQSRCRILTDTPERNAIALQHATKITKAKKRKTSL